MTQMKSVCGAGRVGQRDDRIAETTPTGALPESVLTPQAPGGRGSGRRVCPGSEQRRVV